MTADQKENSGPARILVVVLSDVASEVDRFVHGLPELQADCADGTCWTVLMGQEPPPTEADSGTETVSGRWDVEHYCVAPSREEIGHVLKTILLSAVDADFDLIYPIPNAADYEPLVIVELLEHWQHHRPDVVLGAAGAKDVFPEHFLQRIISRPDLDFLTPYRAFNMPCIAKLRLMLNANDERFLTELLLQAIHAGAIVSSCELPASAGTRKLAGWPAFRAGLRYLMHEWGMFCSLQYHRADSTRYVDKTGIPYSSHRMALEEVERREPARVLDLGCGSGFVSAQCRKLGAVVTGVDLHQPDAATIDEFFEANLADLDLPVDTDNFDLILLLDVIEHLAEPEELLIQLRKQAISSPEKDDRAPTLILSTPNIAFFSIRLNLLLGRFTYAERGILDISHKRLFTHRSLLDALTTCGYEVERIRAVPVPFATVIPGRCGRIMGFFAKCAAKLLPSLFAFQYLVVSRPRPPARLTTVNPADS